MKIKLVITLAFTMLLGRYVYASDFEEGLGTLNKGISKKQQVEKSVQDHSDRAKEEGKAQQEQSQEAINLQKQGQQDALTIKKEETMAPAKEEGKKLNKKEKALKMKKKEMIELAK